MEGFSSFRPLTEPVSTDWRTHPFQDEFSRQQGAFCENAELIDTLAGDVVLHTVKANQVHQQGVWDRFAPALSCDYNCLLQIYKDALLFVQQLKDNARDFKASQKYIAALTPTADERALHQERLEEVTSAYLSATVWYKATAQIVESLRKKMLTFQWTIEANGAPPFSLGFTAYVERKEPKELCYPKQQSTEETTSAPSRTDAAAAPQGSGGEGTTGKAEVAPLPEGNGTITTTEDQELARVSQLFQDLNRVKGNAVRLLAQVKIIDEMGLWGRSQHAIIAGYTSALEPYYAADRYLLEAGKNEEGVSIDIESSRIALAKLVESTRKKLLDLQWVIEGGGKEPSSWGVSKYLLGTKPRLIQSPGGVPTKSQ